MKLTKKQTAEVDELAALPLPAGEQRRIHKCSTARCGRIQAHDFIPFSLGHGRWHRMCTCNAVDGNWIFRAKLLKTIGMAYQRYERPYNSIRFICACGRRQTFPRSPTGGRKATTEYQLEDGTVKRVTPDSKEVQCACGLLTWKDRKGFNGK